MYLGYGSLGLIALSAVLLGISLILQQRFAVWILGFGVFLFLFLGTTLGFQVNVPYEDFRTGIYQVFFMAIILTVSGSVGIIVRLARKRI